VLASHPLDNPVWHSLVNHHAGIAQGDSLARCYPKDIAPFGGVASNDEQPFQSLASLIPSGKTIVLMREYPIDEKTWHLQHQFTVLQMVYDGPAIEQPEAPYSIIPLSPVDVPLMLELVDLTHPGPFRSRTIELGCYLSIWQDGQLAAMAGERFHVPGYHEISAVCTHPNFQKRGYARQLIRQLMYKIQSEGDIPFLHVVPENTGAIALYESLGFKQRIQMPLYVLGRL
jgi:ribosomal protein S18 acetylase RimI-like enzyme